MNIELKILNKRFYSEESNGMLLNPLPYYATDGSAGVDLYCTEDVTVYPGETVAIYTGLAVHIECAKSLCDYMGMIVPRSGLGTRGLVLANTIGIIDQDYQGEITVQAMNRLKDNRSCENKRGNIIQLKAGERIAQLIFVPIVRPSFVVVDEFTHNTDRGCDGFGSTGK